MWTFGERCRMRSIVSVGALRVSDFVGRREEAIVRDLGGLGRGGGSCVEGGRVQCLFMAS